MTNNIWKERPQQQQTDVPSGKEYAEAIYNLPNLVRRVNALERQVKEHYDNSSHTIHITYTVNREQSDLCKQILSQKDILLGEFIDALFDLLNSTDNVDFLEQLIEEFKTKVV